MAKLVERAGSVSEASRKIRKRNILKCKFDVHLNRHQSEEEVNFSTPFHAAFGFLIMLLLALVGVHFQGLGVSPLKTHFATMLLFLMAVVIYSIAFVGIKVGAHNTSCRYLPLFNFICLISGTLACELLVSILIAALWLLIINLCAILVEVLRRWYQPIFDRLCHPAN